MDPDDHTNGSVAGTALIPGMPTDDDLYRDPVGALARLPTDRDLPFDDGVPMDSPWHRACMNVLIDSMEHHWRDRKDFYVGGDMFVYYSDRLVYNRDFRGPDFFVVLDTDHDKPRKSWVVWREGGQHPDVVIELASETTRHVDRGEKKRLYAQSWRTSEYYIYDPSEELLEGWLLGSGGYESK